MSWASKRKTIYLGSIIGVFVIILAIFILPIIFKAPTCSDGKQNGEETGVDCGGKCSLVCSSEAKTPTVLWSRAFPVIDGNYNLIALIDNKNKDAAIQEISYEFRAYDSSNRLIGRREGKTFIPPNERFAVFEPRFKATDGEIKSVYFEFTSPYVWITKEPKIQSLPIKVDKITMENIETSPLLKARLVNGSNYDFPYFDVVAIVYDKDGNALNASKTYKNGVKSGSSVDIFFTWPIPFSDTPTNFEVIPLFNPFKLPF